MLNCELRVSLTIAGGVLYDLEGITGLHEGNLEERSSEIETNNIGLCLTTQTGE